MSVQITGLDRAFIERSVKSGRFASAAEVVRESLRLMEAHQADLAVVRAKLEVGVQQLKRGEFVDGPAFMRAMKQKYASRRRASA